MCLLYFSVGGFEMKGFVFVFILFYDLKDIGLSFIVMC